MTLIVGQVMTSEVVGARREMSFKDVARLLDRYRISGLPVVDDDDKVVGVISETDLLRSGTARSGRGREPRRRPRSLRRALPWPWPWQSSGPRRTATAGAGAAEAGAARRGTAEQLMSTPAITVHPEQRVADAARVMERHGVERLPVVDEEDRLIGIATRRDLLRVFLRTDEEIRREVTDVLGRALSVPPGSVIVSVGDGVVRLEGRLERRGEIPEAVGLAWRVDGVVGVMNGLTFRVDDTHSAEPRPPHRIEHHRLPERRTPGGPRRT
ncbi:CBS domain-containing protein [Streptomyces sp. NPDC127038]|uniref:CBS domain-containing protein n=1 Tax=Streptomyces sp. NPDC127038 TaxID=3347114 RepID=UPI00364BC6F4